MRQPKLTQFSSNEAKAALFWAPAARFTDEQSKRLSAWSLWAAAGI